MLIQFDSIEELDAFINWSGRGIAAIETIDVPDPKLNLSPEVIDTFPDAIAPDEAQTPAQAADSIAHHEAQNARNAEFIAETVAANAAEKAPQRKRRTKAEMEAARAAEMAAEITQAPVVKHDDIIDAAVQVALMYEGNPFAAAAPAANAAIQAALAGAPAGQTLAALAEVSVADQPAAVVPKSTKPTDPEHIKTWLHDTAVGNIGPLDMGSHMARAKAFIAKNGNAKYNESFVVAGLDPNIMVYSDEQRSLHAAALEFVDWQ